MCDLAFSGNKNSFNGNWINHIKPVKFLHESSFDKQCEVEDCKCNKPEFCWCDRCHQYLSEETKKCCKVKPERLCKKHQEEKYKEEHRNFLHHILLENTGVELTAYKITMWAIALTNLFILLTSPIIIGFVLTMDVAFGMFVFIMWVVGFPGYVGADWF